MNISKLDDKNFELIFRENYAILCRFCIRFVRIPEIAEEIVQDQFITLWEKRDMIEIHTSLKAYLYKSVKNKSIDYLKSKMAKHKLTETSSFSDISDYNSPYQILESNETINTIEQAIQQLPEKCYAVFSLSRFAGMSNKEVAEELNISIKTVENQITIALKKIKVFLSKKGITILLPVGYILAKLSYLDWIFIWGLMVLFSSYV
jgi:RNA polymerase sigma-70 factor, ECF subfamily